jgi:CheY-like chemotaxis protein
MAYLNNLLGGVSIATKVGEGTTVTVYLPRTTSKPVLRTVESRDEAPLTVHRATILVVDDDRDVRELATSCLETLGYHVLKAEGGRAAIDLICSETAVDLVLIDVAMPDINGVETIRAVRKRRPDLRFLYMTGYVGATPLDPSEKRVLNKPFTLAGLAAKVEEALFPADMTRLAIVSLGNSSAASAGGIPRKVVTWLFCPRTQVGHVTE